MFQFVSSLFQLLLITWVLIVPAQLTAAELNSKTPERLVTADLQLKYLESENSDLTISDILARGDLFVELPGDVPSFGFTTSTYWFSMDLDVSDRDQDRWILDVSYPLLDHVDLFVVSKGQVINSYRSGDSRPFGERPILDRSFSFPLLLNSQLESLSLYLRVESSSSIQLPISLWREQAYFQSDHNEQLWLGLYYGFLLAILLYNGLLARSIKDSVYIYYCAYVATYCLFQLAINGLGYEYFWPDLPVWNERATPIFMAICIAMALMFARKFLQIDKATFPKLNQLYLVSIWLQVPMLLVGLFADYLVAIRLLTATTASLGLLLLVTGFIVFLHKGEKARFYLIAWTFFLIGVLVYAFKTWGLLPKNFFTEYAIQFGSASEMLLLSYALADRFKRIKEENERFQKETALALEKRVEERTAELQDALDTLSAANRSLEHLSTRDSLTDTFNRAYFNQHFQYIWNAATRNDEPVSLLMIDIDHFKSINDNHGHVSGDTVIVEVAQRIDAQLTRATDLLARYGGEEFIVVLPNTELEGAVVVADRIRQSIADREIGLSSRAVNVTASIGVACFNPRLDHTKRSLDLIEMADEALYRAKNAGRNRIRFMADSNAAFSGDPTNDASTDTLLQNHDNTKNESISRGDNGERSDPDLGSAA